MKRIVLLIFLVLLSSCDNLKRKKIEFKNKNKLSLKTQTIVSRLIDYGIVTGPFVGELGVKTKQWDNFIELKKSVTEQELMVLMEHPNSVVKCYSFDILISKKNKYCYNILKSRLKDSTSVTTSFGCLMNDTQVNDYLINSFLNNVFLRSDTLKKEKRELDSLVIFTPNLILNYKNRLLKKIEPNKNFYSRIKKLALSGNYEAIVALSKFNKKEDISIIDKLLGSNNTEVQRFGLMSVKSFTDKAFFKKVVTIHEQELKKKNADDYFVVRLLYEAIVSYKNIESRDLLEKSIQKTEGFQREFHFKYIWKALRSNPDKAYKGIIKKLNFSEYELKNLEYEWSINNFKN
ncbi:MULTISPECIES: hypothetical protein [unclassified Tenacibaculum]|uniref:hypothetical protein n=1 Tax=unclassified Tenacibaculum TaxID=2635139 RepID=UPI001F32DCE6|nr:MULTISPECIES: hypothetical protein [unclassified Tenacibaculum]MCF2874408.1 hypothetical protein [Tenacibaculum sp. Cn5-1]MCF2934989.1 hypothetical protein [Tenacibaculum sp. Cn5-34]MCG7511199.1 hypothetical protein [Tenacibaculum sp. Cn5-46]